MTCSPSAGTDVDLQNRLDGATPLHLAIKLENPAARQGVVEMLLDAGADPRSVTPPTPPLSQPSSAQFTNAPQRVLTFLWPHRIKDKHGEEVAAALSPDSCPEDAAIQRAIAISIAEFTVGGVDGGDIASDDDEGEPGSGSGSESEED